MMNSFFLPLLLLAASLQGQERPVAEITIPGTSVSFELVQIPGGRIALAGKEGRPGRVVEVRPFWLGRFEVTWREFKPYSGDESASPVRLFQVDGITRPTRADSYFPQVHVPDHFLNPERPVTNARLHATLGYCDWLTRVTGRRFRLPTEAEWEHAARAGDREAFPAALGDVAWYKSNSDGRTHAGGERKANAFGVHDMLGNVWEYCLDLFQPPRYSPVMRGGAWKSPASELLYAHRRTVDAEWHKADPQDPKSNWWFAADHAQGFRVVSVGDARAREEAEAYASRIEVRVDGRREVSARERPALGSDAMEVWGQVRNAGDRTVEEMDLTVYYLDPEGRPHPIDEIPSAGKPGRATFGRCWPVMVGSGGEEEARPLKAGESREFRVDVPFSEDPDDLVDREKFGGRATGLRLAPR